MGLDLGTNSLGWAVVEETGDGYRLLEHGVDIFQEGVKIEKGNESSKAAERTSFRLARRRLMRRKLRKIETLKVLSDNRLCPPLSWQSLKAWKQQGRYPMFDEFLAWQRTGGDNNPYFCRHAALNGKLDLEKESGRHLLGRAMYHMAQRRGFLSNRLEKTRESDGAVKEGISALNAEMEEAGCLFLGEFFHYCYEKGDKIRTRYTSRKEHYKAEFDEICRVQELPAELKQDLERAIFFQRPLRSQRGMVGKCTFEKSKSRCPASHPRFEEYRMLGFINNIRIQTPQDDSLRPLTKAEKDAIIPLFLRKSKKQFDFEDIAKKLAGKDNYAYYKSRDTRPYLFNYRKDTSVSGCPVTAQLIDVFGDDWQEAIAGRYTAREMKTGTKSHDQMVDDVWHALFFFKDDEKLKNFAIEKLLCNDEKATKFAGIELSQEYASLSLNAIGKILPFLREGLLYSHAVFLANMGKVVPAGVWNESASRSLITREVMSIVDNFSKDDLRAGNTIEKLIGEFMLNNFGIETETLKKVLYHPSMIDDYPEVRPDKRGEVRLGSPRTDAVRNPMAMRSLFRLRKLVNTLLAEGKIDRGAKIRIEFARGLNDANMRRAIELYQRERETERKKYRDEIKKLYFEETGCHIEPTDTDILKFQLREEQGGICPYTGRNIGISQFIGANPEFDIEHTIPLSAGGDNSQMNKTLCESEFNRKVKREKIPSELAGHSDILVRIEPWKERYEGLRKQISTTKKQSTSSKEQKDRVIQKRRKLQMEYDYWHGKYRRFTMPEVPEGFRNSQGVDIGIISKYARLYLKSVFPATYVVKGITTAEFRKMWGLQDQYEKKERANHIHHCIDAITIACIGPSQYGEMAHEFYRDMEHYRWQRNCEKPRFAKPWPTFTEDVMAIEQELLVSHHTPDKMPRQTCKTVRVRGRIQKGADGKPLYAQGDSVRGSLHQDTVYGAILREGEVRHVVRKALGNLKEADIDKIVDEAVREKVKAAIAAKGFKPAMAEPVWMNEEKGIQIKKVRCYTPTVTSPICLKEHRDISRHEHKRHLRVVNDGNYMMAVYEGTDARGKVKRDFEMVNNLDAARYFKSSSDREAFPELIPGSKKGLPLKFALKTGTMVIFWANSPEELYELDKRELRKRLYKVTKMSKDGRATFKFHQESRNDEMLKSDYEKMHNKTAPGTLTSGVSAVDFNTPAPKLCITSGNFNMMVEGYDFKLTVTGEIRFNRD